jgi:hypothetical protein
MLAISFVKKSRDMLLGMLQIAAVDQAVAFAVLGNIAALILGPITALLIATRFSPELQGYYYTFGSLLTLQVLLDVGFGQAVIQFASHEWSRLTLDHEGRIGGDADSLSRHQSGPAFIQVVWRIGPTACAGTWLCWSGFLFRVANFWHSVAMALAGSVFGRRCKLCFDADILFAARMQPGRPVLVLSVHSTNRQWFITLDSHSAGSQIVDIAFRCGMWLGVERCFSVAAISQVFSVFSCGSGWFTNWLAQRRVAYAMASCH